MLLQKTTLVKMFNIVFLAAGKGSRMQGMNGQFPKCLMKFGNGTILSNLVEAALPINPNKISIVGGYGINHLSEYINSCYWGKQVNLINNEKYAYDRNIYSAFKAQKNHLGEGGVLFVETDTYLTNEAWQIIENALLKQVSFITVSKNYSKENTGGFVVSDNADNLIKLGYQPKYLNELEGAHRMAGMLYISSKDMQKDFELRKKLAYKDIDRYYFESLIDFEDKFSIKILSLPENFISAFNTKEEYYETLRSANSIKSTDI